MDDRKNRPGVMIYFDTVLPALNYLTDEQLGALFRALLLYASGGERPELDNVTGLVFELIAPRIDKDWFRYVESCEQRRYAAYSREEKKRGMTPLSFAEWKLLPGDRLLTNDNGSLLKNGVSFSARYGSSPTITITPTVTVTSKTERKSNSFGKEERRGGGEKKEGKPFSGKSAGAKAPERKKKGAGEP